MVDWNPKLMATLAAVVAVLAVLGFALHFTGPSTTGAATGTGACVIIPNQQAAVESLGKGLVNSDHVCDAATNGCSYCLAQCELFSKIVDKYGCAEKPTDGVYGTASYSFRGMSPAPTDLVPSTTGGGYININKDGSFDFASQPCDETTTLTSAAVKWEIPGPITAGETFTINLAELHNSELLSQFDEQWVRIDDLITGSSDTLMMLSDMTVGGDNVLTLTQNHPNGIRVWFFLTDRCEGPW
jgi:hypothetical protein